MRARRLSVVGGGVAPRWVGLTMHNGTGVCCAGSGGVNGEAGADERQANGGLVPGEGEGTDGQTGSFLQRMWEWLLAIEVDTALMVNEVEDILPLSGNQEGIDFLRSGGEADD